MEVSVKAFEPAEQQRFAELAVFRPDHTTPDAAAVTLWNHTGGLNDRQGRKLLVKLWKRSLAQLEETGSAVAASVGQFALHDLLYDFTVSMIQRWDGRLKGLHHELVEAYRKKCADGWHTGPDEGYLFSHLAEHLVEADRSKELAELLQDLRWLEAKTPAGWSLSCRSTSVAP